MFIVDRVEGDWAIIETESRQTFNLPRAILPSGVKEGDVVNIFVNVDSALTEERSKKAKKLLDNFFDK
jgi:hypothetical protein